MKAIIFLILIIFSIRPAPAQEEENEKKEPWAQENYHLDFLSFDSGQKGTTRLDVFLQVPYDQMQFLKNAEGFSANYSVTISVFDEKKENIIVEKSWSEKLAAKQFDQTVSKNNFNLSLKSFNLKPDKYLIRTAVEDKDSRKEMVTEKMVSVRDLSDYPSLSDIMIISKRTQENGNNRIIPNVTKDVNVGRDSMKIFFEVYSNKEESISLEYRIQDKNKEVLFDLTEEKKLDSGRNQVFSTLGNVKIGMGRYILSVNVKDGSGKGAAVSKRFTSRWTGIPAMIEDLDKAVDQLVYIATPSEINQIEDAETEDNKIKEYLAFWKKKDPTPNTEENELFNEYYRRVHYANENFTHYMEGWRSDRGMVFIILGSPNNIDRHPFELESKPYEIWQYYDLNRSFVFVDETGFGDYRLITPLVGDDYRFRN